jgi:hypothetical protein
MSVGTHQTHCCEKHGCRYGKETCAVVTKEVEQSYPCPQCRSTSAIDAEIKELEEEREWSSRLEAKGMKIYDYDY